MNKKNINHILNSSLWLLVFVLPISILLICYAKGSFITLKEVFELCGLSIVNNNIILDSLTKIFGVGGVLPLFQNYDLLIYFSYFCGVWLVRLAVEVLLFIPKLSYHWLKRLGGKENNEDI